jgi:hypothetical protein
MVGLDGVICSAINAMLTVTVLPGEHADDGEYAESVTL